MTSAAIVVIAYRSRDPLTRFLDSLGGGHDVVIVNNSADEDDLADLDERRNVRVVDAGGNVGFSAGANIGARSSDAELLIFMNPDTLPTPASVDALIAAVGDENGAVCGPTGVGTAGGGAQPTMWRVLAHTLGLHRVFPTVGLYFYPKHGERLEAGWISGSCCAVSREVFESVGGYDEAYFVFMSDFEFGLRLSRGGHRQVVLGDVVVEHFDGGSSDLPAEWTWQQRGKGWGQFLNRTQPTVAAGIMAATLVVGFSARRVLYKAMGRSVKAAEQSTMVEALRQERSRPS